ncbi:MAG: hypothetical protein Q4F05_16135 [bacterium]|nr:hypothetical protein [bacterium]
MKGTYISMICGAGTIVLSLAFMFVLFWIKRLIYECINKKGR